MSSSVNQKASSNDLYSSADQSHYSKPETYSTRRLSSPTPTSSHLGTSLPSTAAMTMSASAKFHHNTEESTSQTPCCTPTPQESQKLIKEAERPSTLQQTTPISVKVNQHEHKPASTPISNKSHNATSTPTSKKVTFMSVSESNEYFEKAKKERQRKLSADNIGNFLDLGDLAAWNMKAVIVPRRKPHRHNANLPRHKDPFIEIPSNKTVKNLSQPQKYLLRRGSAAAEIRLPDRQQRRVSAQPDQYGGAGSVAARTLTSSNNNHLPHSPRVAKVQRSKSSRTADAVELATIKAWRVLSRQRRNSTEEKLLEKEKRAFGNDSKLISRSPSQRQLQAELRDHTTHWQDQETDSRENRRQKSIIRRRSTSDHHSITEGQRRNSEEVQWKILNNYIQRMPAKKTKECASCNKTCNGGKGSCEVSGDELDQANGNHNLSQVAQQISIIPRQAISINASEAMPLMPNTKLHNRRRAESNSSEMLKTNIF